jgi:glycosyltransferase involved in cell wall biosynthesis
VRVLIVSQYFWPETFRITEVARSLQDAGAEITVLTGQPNYPQGRIFQGFRASGAGHERHPDGYPVFRVPIVPRGRGGALRLFVNYLSFVVTAAVIGPWLLRGRRFDVIFVYAVSPILQALPAAMLKWLKRAALVIWVQDLWPESLAATGFVRNRWLLRGTAAMTRWIYRRADLLLVQSRAFIAAVMPMAGGVSVAYHPNPGDLGFGGAPVAAPAYTLQPGFNVVWAGNVGNAQSPGTLIEAAARLAKHPEIRIVVFGEGSRLAWLEAEKAKRGLNNLVLAGSFPSAVMPAILSQASALLLVLGSDATLDKTVPSRLITYLAAGRPIIGSIGGEGALVIGEAKAGLVCAPADGTALAAAVLRMSELGEDTRAAMSEAGRRYYEANFQPEVLAAALLRHFNRAISLRRSGHEETVH